MLGRWTLCLAHHHRCAGGDLDGRNCALVVRSTRQYAEEKRYFFFCEQRMWHMRSSEEQPHGPPDAFGTGFGDEPGCGDAPGWGLGPGRPTATLGVALDDALADAVAVVATFGSGSGSSVIVGVGVGVATGDALGVVGCSPESRTKMNIRAAPITTTRAARPRIRPRPLPSGGATEIEGAGAIACGGGAPSGNKPSAAIGAGVDAAPAEDSLPMPCARALRSMSPESSLVVEELLGGELPGEPPTFEVSMLSEKIAESSVRG